MDYISIDNLEVFANHGVFEEEVNLGQKFIVSVRLYFDASAAGREDDLKKSVNYTKVCAGITQWMKTNSCKLIETVAERLAHKLLTDYGIVRSVEVTVKKPWAPIGLPLEHVSITVERGWHTAYLSIGSNIGDRSRYLEDGIEHLRDCEDIRILAVSDFINTAPYGKTDQDDFLNAAVKLETLLSPEQLLDVLHEAEDAAGRVRDEHWGPRTLDMDILLYDDLIMSTDTLTIPHADMPNRDFVLRPLCQIAPYALHPVTGRRICELAENQRINYNISG